MVALAFVLAAAADEPAFNRRATATAQILAGIAPTSSDSIGIQLVPPSKKPMRKLGNASNTPSTITPVAAMASGTGMPRARVAGNTV